MDYRIGEFSQMAKTTVKTLRFYDEIGLLSPNRVDQWTGYRYYSNEQLFPLQKIISYREAGLSIEEIKLVLNGVDVSAILESRKETLLKENEDIINRISRIDKLIKSEKEKKTMNYEVKVREIPEYVVYYKRGIIPSFEGVLPFVLSAGEEVRKNNPTLKCLEDDYCYVGYLDEAYKEKDILVEYAQAVEKVGNESENIKFRKLDKQKCVCVNHKGPYQSIRNAYATGLSYVESNGYKMCGPIRERYIHGCWDCENEEDYLTEVEIPVLDK